MKPSLIILVVFSLLTACDSTGIKDDMAGETGYVPAWKEHKGRASDVAGATEEKDRERNRQLDALGE